MKRTSPTPTDLESIPSLLRCRLGMALQRRRVRAGLTQAGLAHHVNLSLKYVGQIERGEANVTLDVIERLARAVNWDPMDEFGGLDEPISEGVRVLLIELLGGIVKGLQQAIRWLHALAPARNRSTVENSGAVESSDESRRAGKPRSTNRHLSSPEE